MLAIHIIGVALWLGSNIAMGVGSSRAEGASAETNAWWAETQGFLGRTVKNAAAVLVLVTGLVMVIDNKDEWKFSAPFVSVGFLAVIVGAVAGMAVFGPGCRKIAESFRNGDTTTATTTINKLGLVGAAESLVVVVTILFMVFKWGS